MAQHTYNRTNDYQKDRIAEKLNLQPQFIRFSTLNTRAIKNLNKLLPEHKDGLMHLVALCGGHEYAYWLAPSIKTLDNEWAIACFDGKKCAIFKIPANKFRASVFRQYEEFNRVSTTQFELVMHVDIERQIYKCYGRDPENPIDFAPYLALITDREIQTIYYERDRPPRKKMPQFTGTPIERVCQRIAFARDEKFAFTDEQEQVVKFDYADADNALVVASAGCGKSTVLLGHAMHLMETGKITSGDDIVFVVFNNKNKQDLQNKLAEYELDTYTGSVHTFHSLGLSIVQEQDNRNCIEPESPDAPLRTVLDRYIHDKKGGTQWIQNLWKFGTDLTDDKTIIDTTPYSNLIRDPYARNIVASLEHAGTSLLDKPRTTDVIFIRLCNMLAMYDLAPRTSFQEFNQLILHESNDSTKQVCRIFWGNKPQELNPCDIFIESLDDGFDTLEKHLRDNGVELKRVPEQTCREMIDDAILRARCNKFKQTAEMFINIFKIRKPHGTESDLDEMRKNLLDEHLDPDERKHITAFFDLLIPVYNDYTKELYDRHLLDFNDMLNDATRYIENGLVKKHYKYILVDEFQDVAEDNYKLIHALLTQTGAHAMCVGDDWQSIYSWRGSDLNYFTNFDKFFPNSTRLFINETFRNGPEFIRIAADFVKRDNSLIQKEPTSRRPKTELIPWYYRVSDRTQYWRRMLTHINAQYPGKSILILCRYGNDFRLAGLKYDEFDRVARELLPDMTIITPGNNSTKTRTTIHSAKGAEADIVIIMNLCKKPMCGTQNFPSDVTTDIVLEPLFVGKDLNDKMEERRLFYVAMTRARTACYLWIPGGNASPYITEIIPDTK